MRVDFANDNCNFCPFRTTEICSEIFFLLQFISIFCNTKVGELKPPPPPPPPPSSSSCAVPDTKEKSTFSLKRFTVVSHTWRSYCRTYHPLCNANGCKKRAKDVTKDLRDEMTTKPSLLSSPRSWVSAYVFSRCSITLCELKCILLQLSSSVSSWVYLRLVSTSHIISWRDIKTQW